MNKKSTSFFSGVAAVAADNVTAEADKIPTGSPRKSTLELISRFARAYHYDADVFPAGMVLN